MVNASQRPSAAARTDRERRQVTVIPVRRRSKVVAGSGRVDGVALHAARLDSHASSEFLKDARIDRRSAEQTTRERPGNPRGHDVLARQE